MLEFSINRENLIRVSKSCTLGATPSALSRCHFGPVFSVLCGGTTDQFQGCPSHQKLNSFLMWRNHRSVGLPHPSQLGCSSSSSSSFSSVSTVCSSILGVLPSSHPRHSELLHLPIGRFGVGSVRFRPIGTVSVGRPIGMKQTLFSPPFYK